VQSFFRKGRSFNGLYETRTAPTYD
jgi:hypothetical protein